MSKKKEKQSPDDQEQVKRLIDDKLRVSWVALNNLESAQGRLLVKDKEINLLLERFGQVTVTELFLTDDYLFLQATGDKDKIRFNFVRINLVRKRDRTIESCQKPEWFLHPGRKIIEADLVDQTKWVEPMTDGNKLEIAHLISEVLYSLPIEPGTSPVGLIPS